MNSAPGRPRLHAHGCVGAGSLAAAGRLRGARDRRSALGAQLAGRPSFVARSRASEDRGGRPRRGATGRRRTDRPSQDLILTTMQEGILLFDGGWRARVRERGPVARHLGSRPARDPQLLPVAAKDLVERVARAAWRRRGRGRNGSPTRWLRITADPAAPTVRCWWWCATSPSRGGSSRCAATSSRTPPMNSRPPPRRSRRRRRRSTTPRRMTRPPSQVRRAAGARGTAPLADRGRPARPLATGDGQRARRTVDLDAIVREEVGRFEAAAPRGRAHARGRRRAGATPVRGSARDLALLVRNLRRQRDPLHATRADGRGRGRQRRRRHGRAQGRRHRASASPRRTCPGSSSASTAWTARDPARPAARASGSPS